MKKHSLSLLLLLLLSLPLTTHGAIPQLSPSELRSIEQQQRQIITQQEEQRRLQEEQFKRREYTPPDGGQLPILPHVNETDPNRCVEVKKITVNKLTQLSESLLRKITFPYENRCLTLADINNLLHDITNQYIERGYITSRAFANPSSQKNKAEGVLEVFVLEGTIENIIINDNGQVHHGLRIAAFPGLEGKILNLRDIEQGPDQINRLSSKNAVMDIEPSTSMGASNIIINTQSEKAWRLSAGFDNLGLRTTGHYQYSASAEYDNYLGLGDQIAVKKTKLSMTIIA